MAGLEKGLPSFGVIVRGPGLLLDSFDSLSRVAGGGSVDMA